MIPRIGGVAPARRGGTPVIMPQPRDSQGRYVSPRWVWFASALLLALLMAARSGVI